MWTCKKCESKVDTDFDVCWKCGTSREGVEDPSFVSADEAPPIMDPVYEPPGSVDVPAADELAAGASADLVEAYQAFSLMESKFLADQLTGAGIPAVSDTQDMQDFMGVLDGNPRVWVRRDDIERAKEWLAEYEQRRKTEHGHPSHLHE